MAKGFYVGVDTDVPIYETLTANIDTGNIDTYFTVENGSYYFAGSGSTWTTNNGGVNSSTATTTLTAKRNMTVTFTYSYSSESNYDKFTLSVAGTTVENAVSGATTTKTITKELTAGQTIVFTYAKDSSTNSNDDKCTFSAMSIAASQQTGSVTKQLARKVRKIYVGIDGIARKVKKAYIGVGGVARLFYPGTTVLSYYGRLTDLPIGRSSMASVAIGNYALFGGGYDSDSTSARVEVYDRSLTHSAAPDLSVARNSLCATAVGGYALFAGGGNSSPYATVDTYDASLTKGIATDLSLARAGLAATTVGGYALISGGNDGSGSASSSKMDVYNESLTRSFADGFICGRTNLSATTVGNYALFGGGSAATSSASAVLLDAYDSSLTHSIPEDISTKVNYKNKRMSLAATTVGDYALFAGGQYMNSNGSEHDEVDAYDRSLVKTIATPLSSARYDLAATTVAEHALFIAGYNSYMVSGSMYLDALKSIEVYNDDLTKSLASDLPSSFGNTSAATIGDYALIVGGEKYATHYKSVYAYAAKY